VTDAPPPPGADQAERALPTIAQAAREVGAEAYAVGGFVRDRVAGLGRERAPGDVDVLVTHSLAAIAERIAAQSGAALVTLGNEKPGVRLVFADRSHIDLSLPRGVSEGRPRLRGQSEAETVCADLRLRDFTANAMALPVSSVGADDWCRHLLDPTGGADDLERRFLRATGPHVWREDPLRLLRALRLAAQLDLRIEDTTRAALMENAPLLRDVAPERIRDELFALLEREDAAAWLRRAAEMGLLLEVMPQLRALRGVAQGG
jgi:tRNA nucleotidyltransferase/poly(A) polymerase